MTLWVGGSVCASFVTFDVGVCFPSWGVFDCTHTAITSANFALTMSFIMVTSPLSQLQLSSAEQRGCGLMTRYVGENDTVSTSSVPFWKVWRFPTQSAPGKQQTLSSQWKQFQNKKRLFGFELGPIVWALILEFVQYYNLIFIWNCAEIQGLKVMNYKDVNVMSEATNSPVQLYVSVHVWGFSTHMCCLASTQFDSAAINTLPPWSIVVGQLLTKPLLILCYTHFISYKFFTIKVLLFSRYWLHDCGAAKTGNGSTRRGEWRSPSSVT